MYEDILVFMGRPRSPKWSSLRDRVVEAHPFCAVCGSKDFLQVHHKQPFHLWPELELEEDNLCVLCEAPGMNCHFRIGHLRSWSSYNPLIDQLLSLYASRPTGRNDQWFPRHYP